MPQSAEKIKDHAPLFREPEYQAMLKNKREQFECGASDAEIAKVGEWTKSWEYREKNLARQALVVNPAKACQPLGAVYAAQGFARTMPFVHGSQGCVAYYRSHLARHFKEPNSAVSSSMTEDAAVFGGLNNMVEGLQNTHALYKPDMIAVSTTCMSEVIGEDLNSFIRTAKEKGAVPKEFDVPFAHTPAFVGSHVNGYDVAIKGILDHFWGAESRQPADDLNGGVNIVPGFDGFAVGNNREIKRMLDLMGVKYTFLSDVSDVFDTPSDGQFRMYDGGTTKEQVKAALHAKATLSMQEACSEKTLEYAAEKGQAVHAFAYPMGVSATDEFLMKVAAIAGRKIPEALELERGRLIDAMADSQAHLHGKTYAVYGDPDFVYGMARMLMELGAEPRHLLCTNPNKGWEERMKALLASSPYGAESQIWAGKDLWHLRSLLATEPTDFLIGNSYGKYLERDLKIPLIRLTFPIFDRHHHHRFPVWGYQGALRVLVVLLDAIFDKLDRETDVPGKTDYSFDLTR